MKHASDYLYIEPILDCNLRCRYCYLNNDQRGELTEDDVRQFIRRVQTVADISTFSWIGHGEICLWKPWTTLVNELTATHIVQTNGIGLVERLLEVDWLDKMRVRLSVDGLKKHHETNRGAGTFAVMERTLRWLSEMRVKTLVRSLLTPKSVGEAGLFRDWVKGIDASFDVRFTIPFTKKQVDKYRGYGCEFVGPDFGTYDEKAFEKACETAEGLNDDDDTPDTYLALTVNGVYSCCEAQHKIGKIDDDPRLLVERSRECGGCLFLKENECRLE